MKKLFLLSTLCLLSVVCFSQIEATTKDGKKVILNNDGTWKYLDKPENKTISSNYECSDLISTETDKMTGKTSTGAKESLIISDDGGKYGFGIYMLKTEKSIIFSIKAVGAGSCIDDDNKMNVLFRDGTRLEMSNNGKFNCEAKFTLYFGGIFGNKEQLEMFKTKEIETLRIWTSKSYVEKDFTPDQSKRFMKTVECLANN